MKVKARRVRKPRIPKLSVDRQTWIAVASVAIGDMLDRIDNQQQPNGMRIKCNAQSTLDRKLRLGRGQLSLHDTGKRFHKKTGYKITHLRRGVGVVIAPKDQTVAGYVIKMGYRWIGMSRAGWAGVRALIRAALRRSIKRARR